MRYKMKLSTWFIYSSIDGNAWVLKRTFRTPEESPFLPFLAIHIIDKLMMKGKTIKIVKEDLG